MSEAEAKVGLNGTNGFAPDNFAEFPSAVKRMVPTSIGLLVFTVSDIYLIQGNGTSGNPITPVPYATGIGLLSYNALDVNGTTITSKIAGKSRLRTAFNVLSSSSSISSLISSFSRG